MPKHSTKKPEHTTMKVPNSARKLAEQLLMKVSAEGWHAVGSERTDPPTLGAVMEEGLKQLAQRFDSMKQKTDDSTT